MKQIKGKDSSTSLKFIFYVSKVVKIVETNDFW